MSNSADRERLISLLAPNYGEVECAGGIGPTRVGIVVPVFGRPNYVRRCLESLAQSRLENCVICLVDESVSDLRPPEYAGFEALPGMDSPGGDLGPLPGMTIPEVAARSAETPGCVAFNTNGWQKSRLALWPGRSPGLTLYVRPARMPAWWRWFSRKYSPRPSPEANRLVRDWAPAGVRVVKISKSRHGSMFDSLAHGWRLLVEGYGCQLLMSLDSDTLVKPDWVTRVVEVHDQNRPSVEGPLLVTGFHSPNHRTLATRPTYRVKKSMGGMNMLFDLQTWSGHVEPCLISLQWDSDLCRRVRAAGGGMLASKPSVVQHIGRFGLWSGLFRFDRAWDF